MKKNFESKQRQNQYNQYVICRTKEELHDYPYIAVFSLFLVFNVLLDVLREKREKRKRRDGGKRL